MSQIFISYRRADSKTVTGRIYDRLISALGRRNVFKDVNDIPAGADFPALLRQITSTCKVMLVIIGRSWATVTDEEGRPRLDDPLDFVRLEVETGLTTEGVTVVPVLVEGASMPRPSQLPPSLHPLLTRNAVVVRDDPDFHDDMDSLIEGVRPLLARRRPNPSLIIAGVFVVALAILGLLLVNSMSRDNELASTATQLALLLSATSEPRSASATPTVPLTRTPVPDSDGDGINDLNDACPFEPAPSTLLGCPPPTRRSADSPSPVPNTPTPSITPSPEGQVLVRISTLGTWIYDVPDGNTINSIKSSVLPVVGMTEDALWYALELDGKTVWFRASSQARIDGNPDDLPRLSRPTLSPSATPSPTVTPSPTASPTASRTPSPSPSPVPDRDGDGINDLNDACPDQPAAGSLLGCPPPSATPTPEITATPLPRLSRTSFSALAPFSTTLYLDGAFSSTGRYYGDVGGVYETSSGSQVLALQTSSFLGFSPDEQSVWVDTRQDLNAEETGRIVQIDLSTGERLVELEGRLFVFFSPDGQYMATYAPTDSANYLLYRLSDYSLVGEYPTIVFSPNSRYFIFSNAENTRISLYDFSRSAIVFTLTGDYADFTPNSEYLMLGQTAQNNTSLYALADLRVTGWTPRFTLRGQYPLISPDAKWLALENAEQGQTLLYELRSVYAGNSVPAYRLEGINVDFSYDSSLAITRNDDTTRARAYLHRLDPYTLMRLDGIDSLRFAPDTNDYLIASVSSPNFSSQVYQVLSYSFSNSRTSLLANFFAPSFAISPDGATIAADGFLWRTGDQTCQVRLSDAGDLRLAPETSAEAYQRVDDNSLLYANGYLFNEDRVWWRILWEGGILWLDGRGAEPTSSLCDNLPLTTP